MKQLSLIIFFAVFFIYTGNAQKSPLSNDIYTDFDIIKTNGNYISMDSFLNKVVTKFDTIDLYKGMSKGHYYPLYRKGYVVIKVSKKRTYHLEEIFGFLDYQKKQIKDKFEKGDFSIKKALLKYAKGMYIIQPIIIFATDKSTGLAFEKKCYNLAPLNKDTLQRQQLYRVLYENCAESFFWGNNPISMKPWLKAIWLPLIYINKGNNLYYGMY